MLGFGCLKQNEQKRKISSRRKEGKAKASTPGLQPAWSLSQCVGPAQPWVVGVGCWTARVRKLSLVAQMEHRQQAGWLFPAFKKVSDVKF